MIKSRTGSQGDLSARLLYSSPHQDKQSIVRPKNVVAVRQHEQEQCKAATLDEIDSAVPNLQAVGITFLGAFRREDRDSLFCVPASRAMHSSTQRRECVRQTTDTVHMSIQGQGFQRSEIMVSPG